MRRDPKERISKEFKKRSKVKKIHPRFFYVTCDFCGMEVKNEDMYEYQSPSIIFEGRTDYKTGCSKCFSSLSEFENKMNKETDRRLENLLLVWNY